MEQIQILETKRLAELVEAWHLAEGFDAVEIEVDHDREPTVGTAYNYTCSRAIRRWYPIKCQTEPNRWETGWVAEDADFGFRYADALD